MAKTSTTKTPATAATSTEARLYVVNAIARPSAGNALYAHTDAFLTLSGLKKGKSIPQAQVIEALGARAVKYHLNNLTFALTEKGIRVSEFGHLIISKRMIDPEMQAAYVEVMTTGKTNAFVKNPAAISPVKA